MQIGLFFAIFPLSYIPCSLIQQYVPKKIDKRLRMIFASVLNAFALLCVGPSDIFYLGDSLIVMAIGQFLIGAMLGFQQIPGLPEMIDSATEQYPKQSKEVKSMVSGIFNQFLGIGYFISPIYGSTLNQYLGFKHTTTIAACIDFSFAILYFACAGGPAAMSKTYANYKHVKEQTTEI